MLLSNQTYPPTGTVGSGCPVEIPSSAYRDAILSQDACNLSGMMNGMAVAMKAVRLEDRRLNEGFGSTLWCNRHPLMVMYTEQAAHLTTGGTSCDPDDYHKVWDYCHAEDRSLSLAEGNRAIFEALRDGMKPDAVPVNMVLDYPGIRFDTSGFGTPLHAIAAVATELHAKYEQEDAQRGWGLLCGKLRYLSDYGGDNYSVLLTGSQHDASMLNVLWYRGGVEYSQRGAPQSNPTVQGGLTCSVFRGEAITDYTFGVHT